MLVDGGVASSYDTLRTALARIPQDRHGQRVIDLLVVTHIDCDHIEGIIRLLCDQVIRLAPRDVWFNGWPQLRRSGTGDLSPEQGEWLGSLLTRGGIAWNEAFAGEDRRRVAVPDGGPLPRRSINGLDLILLSPNPPALDRLRRQWGEVIRAAGGVPGNIDAAISQLEQKGWLVDPSILGAGPDDSLTNETSIALVAAYEGHQLLLTADAHRDVLTTSLRRLAGEDGSPEAPVPIGLCKLPHHGSIRNIDGGFLRAISCRRFLVTTSGARFQHPDRAAINLVIDSVPGAEIIFNYESRTTAPWARSEDQQRRGYTARFPKNGRTVVTI